MQDSTLSLSDRQQHRRLSSGRFTNAAAVSTCDCSPLICPLDGIRCSAAERSLPHCLSSSTSCTWTLHIATSAYCHLNRAPQGAELLVTFLAAGGITTKGGDNDKQIASCVLPYSGLPWAARPAGSSIIDWSLECSFVALNTSAIAIRRIAPGGDGIICW